MPRIIKLAANGYSVEEIAHAAVNMLQAGKIIALPTDTIYGIAALAQHVSAVQNIYKIKGRDPRKPVAICVGDISDIPRWGKITFSRKLLTELFPGQVTVVLERQPALNSSLNPGVPLVGIRIPDDMFIRTVAHNSGGPLALTSANISSSTSTLAVEEFKDLWPCLDLIVDGGVLGRFDPERKGSTVVDLSVKGYYRIIRPGCSLDSTVDILKQYNLHELCG